MLTGDQKHFFFRDAMYTISKITAMDRLQWEKLYAEYAAFYEMEMTETTLNVVWSWILDEHLPFYAVAVKDTNHRMVAIAHYKSMPSPLRGVLVGYMDDLYVEPQSRGKHVVEAIFRFLRQECHEHGWPFIRWITKDDNYRARAAYEKFALKTDWVTYQLNVSEA